MPFTPLEIERIARLARIEVAPDEVRASPGQLNDILSLVETLRSFDTADVEPMVHPHEATPRLREDEITCNDADGTARALLQSMAPEVKDGLYLVPKVIE